jgi:DNA-binding transcriptional ArsR family regulator
MNGDYLIKLTLLAYRMSENWNESDFLRSQLRNLANEILTDFILVSHNKLEFKQRLFRNIDSIQARLVEARSKKLIDRKKFLLFQDEYNKIKDEFKTIVRKEKEQKEQRPIEKRKKKNKKRPKLEDLSERQLKILDILREREKIQVWQLKEIFSGVTKRTLRRDLDQLLKKGLLKRQGKFNEVFYTLC